MMFLTILLSTIFAFTSVNADYTMDLSVCQDMLSSLDLEDRETLPADLDDMCPTILRAIDCLEEAIEKETSLPLAELGSVLQGRPAEVVTFGVNTINLIKDLCDTDSELRKDYDKDTECFKTANLLGNDNNVPCAEEAKDAIDVYEKVYNSLEGDSNEGSYNRECMTTAYTVACAGKILKEKCGDRAFNTFRTIVKRTTFFKYGICSEQQVENLKDFALEHIDVDGTDRELIQLAFDLKKRRK